MRALGIQLEITMTHNNDRAAIDAQQQAEQLAPAKRGWHWDGGLTWAEQWLSCWTTPLRCVFLIVNWKAWHLGLVRDGATRSLLLGPVTIGRNRVDENAALLASYLRQKSRRERRRLDRMVQRQAPRRAITR